MFFCREKFCVRTVAVFFLISGFVLSAPDAEAQSRRVSRKENQKPTSGKNAARNQESAQKDKKSADKKSSIKEERAAKKDENRSKSSKPSKAELARREALEREQARRNEEIRRAEEARRQAILEEKRRREQAAREARARRIAFERGLRTETIENIASDNTDGEDLEARRAAINALGNHAGTIVVMEAQTGKVLTVVNQDWAIRKGFKPCSTIKLVTGVAGLNEKAIDQNGNVRSRRFPMNLNDALAFSNNSYFQVVGRNFGNQKMISYARALGLGEPTGINAGGETAGRLPYGNNNARIYSHGDDFEVTPLQLAVMVSAISNGGKLVVPQTPRTRSEKANFRGFMRRQVNLPAENVQGVLSGMIGAVNYGTARRSGSADFSAAGKTGSCIGQGSWLGLFASVAPVVNPKYAVVVITRGQAERGKYASAIAGKVYRALGARLRENGGREQIAKLPLQLKPQPKINAQTSALLDDGEDEDSDENEFDSKTEASQKPNPKKGGDDVAVNRAAPSENRNVNNDNVNGAINNKIAARRKDAPARTFAPVVIQINREPTRPRIVPMKNK